MLQREIITDAQRAPAASNRSKGARGQEAFHDRFI
jgi:hypothetical protein